MLQIDRLLERAKARGVSQRSSWPPSVLIPRASASWPGCSYTLNYLWACLMIGM